MRPSTPRAPQGRSLVGTLGLALAVAVMLVGGSLGPALSDDHAQRNRQEERDWRAHHSNPQAYKPYHYYAPPPVVYAPLPSPGISLFFGFPIQIH
jgi:hypothetical protein